jgi:hypothetical protein
VSFLLRSFWFATAAVLYVAFASLQADPRGLYVWFLVVAGPVVLWLTWRYTGTQNGLAERDPEVRRDCIRAATTGALIFAGARTGPLGHSGFDAAANLGVGVTLVAANIALSRLKGRAGLLSTAKTTTRSIDSAVFAALLWGTATALPAIRSVLSGSLLQLDPVAIDYATVTAAMASLLLMLAVTLRLRWQRRLELDIADRAVSALTVSSVALLATLPALLLKVVPPDRALPVVVVVSGLFYVWTATAVEAQRVSSSLRALLAVLTFLSPLVLFLALLSRRAPVLAPTLIVTTAAVSVVLGLLAARLSRPLAPEQSRWLDAIDKASRAALVPDPDDALRETLVALGPIAPGPSSRVELWRLHPQSVIYVDIAGQLHDENAQIPNVVVELSEGEPERTLRTDVLRAVQVRNPRARDALSYFDIRHTSCVTLLTSESGPLGLLALPEGHRRSPLSLEEAVALHRLAERLESVLAITSAQARSRQRELEALTKVNVLTEETARLAAALENDGARHRRAAERYTRRLKPTLYSPSAKAVQITLERLAKTAQEVSLILPPGSDALGWASLVHLASPREAGPFVVFDAEASDFDAENWEDQWLCPIAFAETGTWVLVNPQALSAPQLEIVVQAMIRHKATRNLGTAPALGMVLARHRASNPTESEETRLSALSQMFPPEARVTIPSLFERGDDLRAIIYERTARLGAVLRGHPLGVDPAALSVLLEHDWPLNDAELELVLNALVLATEGDIVTTDALARIGFGRLHVPLEPEAPESTKDTRRRRRPGTRTIRPRER